MNSIVQKLKGIWAKPDITGTKKSTYVVTIHSKKPPSYTPSSKGQRRTATLMAGSGTLKMQRWANYDRAREGRAQYPRATQECTTEAHKNSISQPYSLSPPPEHSQLGFYKQWFLRLYYEFIVAIFRNKGRGIKSLGFGLREACI